MAPKIRLHGPETQFSKWVNKHHLLPNTVLVVTDVDGMLVFHKHHEDMIGGRDVQHLMLIEYKTRGADCSDSQRDTLKMLSQALSKVTSKTKRPRAAKSQRVFSSMRCGDVTLKTWGVHLLQFSGTSPADSKQMRWDGKKIGQWELECLLRFELNPWTLKPHRDRRHH